VTDVKPGAQAEPAGGFGPFNSLGFLLSQTGYVAAQRFHKTMAPLGLEPRHFFVLRVVSQQEGRSQQSLGELLRIPASRMVGLIDVLEQHGLVERRPNPSDRRARALYVTDEGRRMLGRAMGTAMQHERTLGTTLAPEERRQLIALLQKIAAEMDLLSGAHPALRGSAEDAEPGEDEVAAG
jgi:DNA-binding MarR family transcriptional regulator